MQKNRWAAGLAALALTSLAACGGDSEQSGSGSTDTESAELEVLSAEEAEEALLPETVMGEEFTASEPSEDSNEGAPGCLSALDDLDDIGSETKAEVEYTSTSEIGLPAVEHSVFSYTEIEPISARIEEVSTALEGCDSVEETDEEGTTYALDVTLSTDATTESAEEEITLEAVGTVSQGGQEFPIGVYMSSVRVENHVSVIAYTDFPEDEAASSAAFSSYVSAAAVRLAAVAAGEEPADEPVALPTAGAGSDRPTCTRRSAGPVVSPGPAHVPCLAWPIRVVRHRPSGWFGDQPRTTGRKVPVLTASQRAHLLDLGGDRP